MDDQSVIQPNKVMVKTPLKTIDTLDDPLGCLGIKNEKQLVAPFEKFGIRMVATFEQTKGATSFSANNLALSPIPFMFRGSEAKKS